jgi:hypothetical protein
MQRTIAAANAASALGVAAVTEGFTGQTTMTKLGLSAGWCSSMLSLSPERLRAPLASTMGDDGDTAGSNPVEVPGSGATQTGTA